MRHAPEYQRQLDNMARALEEELIFARSSPQSDKTLAYRLHRESLLSSPTPQPGDENRVWMCDEVIKVLEQEA